MDVEQAFKEGLSNIPLTVEGAVSKLLPDSHEGAHHQKFIVTLPASRQGGHDNHTILVANNLERAYKVPIKIGDDVEIHGTYVWNKLGGIIHNTHHDDRKACRRTNNGHIVCGPSHEDGWIILSSQKDPHRDS